MMRMLIALCIVLLSLKANAARIAVSAGSVQIEVVDWAVNFYVMMPNSSGHLERVPDFRFVYEPSYVGEYWDFENQIGKDFGPQGTGAPINISLPNDDSVYDLAYTARLPNGSVSTVLERTVKLSNGANFTQIVETFTRDSYKPLHGWKVPVGPNTMKITNRFINWPINATIRPMSISYDDWIDKRAVLLATKTRVEMLFREDAPGFILREPEYWPVYNYEVYKNLQDPVDPNNIPSRPIAQNLLAFRDRRFGLDFVLIRNSSACDGASDENCLWDRLRNHRVNVGNEGYSAIANMSHYPDIPFKYDMPLFMGMALYNRSYIEWDPNIQLLFGTAARVPESSPTLSGEAIFENPGTNAAVIGGSLAACALVVVVALVAFFVGRKALKRKSLARVSRAAEAIRGEDERKRANTISAATPPAVPAEVDEVVTAESKRWTHVSRGRALTNVDVE